MSWSTHVNVYVLQWWRVTTRSFIVLLITIHLSNGLNLRQQSVNFRRSKEIQHVEKSSRYDPGSTIPHRNTCHFWLVGTRGKLKRPILLSIIRIQNYSVIVVSINFRSFLGKLFKKIHQQQVVEYPLQRLRCDVQEARIDVWIDKGKAKAELPFPQRPYTWQSRTTCTTTQDSPLAKRGKLLNNQQCGVLISLFLKTSNWWQGKYKAYVRISHSVCILLVQIFQNEDQPVLLYSLQSW